MTPLIESRALTIHRPGTTEPVLAQVDFRIRPAEIVTVVGPNGSGKSSLIRALLGHMPLASGAVTRRQGLRIGYVPQRDNVFPSLSVEENLQMGAFLRPEMFSDRLDFVTEMFPRLGERLGQRAGSLSGGERQMLAISRALMMNPEVILLDEPSAGLSPVLQDQVFLNTRSINKAGVSVVMVEQNARRCLQICDRGYVLDQGANAYTDTGQNLLHDPKVIELYLGTLAAAD